MNELVKINKETIDGDEQSVVNARDLWRFLESRQDFSNWIKNRIEKYEFVVNIDYSISLLNTAISAMAKPLTEYHITLDMAKELSMVERNEKGKIARQYFIECEKQLRKIVISKLPQSYGEALLEAGKLALANEKLESEKQILLPKAEFFDAVTDSKDAIEMSQVAKVLDMGIGRNGIFQILRDRGILRYNNEPYQTYIDSGHFRSVEQKWSKPDGSVHIAIKTLVYQKGVALIKQTIGSAGRLLGE